MGWLSVLNPRPEISFVITVYNLYNVYSIYQNIQTAYKIYQWCVFGINILNKIKNYINDTNKVKPKPGDNIDEPFVFVDLLDEDPVGPES